MAEFPLAITLTFVSYLVVVFAIGCIAWQNTHDASDYFLAGRRLGPWPAALSAGASDMSGWLLLGVPGLAFVAGVEAIWLLMGLLVGTWANWLVVAKRLRVYTEHVQAITLPEYFSRRFGDKKRILQTIAAFFVLLFFLFYTSSGLVAGGKLFQAVFGFEYKWAVSIGALCVLSYTLLGGFFAVSWTDLVQGLLMAAALLIVPMVALQMDGGITTVFDDMRNINPNLLDMFTNASGEPLGWVAIVSLAAWGLGYFGQPHILVRFAAIRSQCDLPTARNIAVSWTFISMLGALLVGFAGLVYVYNTMGADQSALSDPEAIFMLLVNALFHPVIAGILLAAVLAAIMSTVDSQLLVSSSAFAEDFYKAALNKQASSKHVMWVGRMAVVVILLFALAMAFKDDPSVLVLVSYAWAGFGAAFGPAIVLSLFWRDMNAMGALAGIVVGGVTVVIWKQLSDGCFDLYEIIPGFIFSTVAIVVVSLATGKPDEPVYATFDESVKRLI